MEATILLGALLFPLGTALFLNSAGKYLKLNKITLISSLGLLGSFSGFSMMFVLLALNNFHSKNITYFNWIDSMGISFGLQWDGLVAIMTILITFLSLIIQLFSKPYMESDERVARFYVFFNFFVFSMLLLVMASNFLVLFIGWELVGLSSYLLISFWYKKKKAAQAGKKAFILNRVGDFGFLIGLMIIFDLFGSFEYDTIFSNIELLDSQQASMIAFFLMIELSCKTCNE